MTAAGKHEADRSEAKDDGLDYQNNVPEIDSRINAALKQPGRLERALQNY